MAVDEIEIVVVEPPTEPPRRRPPALLVLAVVAALALVVAAFVATRDSGDVDVAVDEDGEEDAGDTERDRPVPEVDAVPAPIALGGPRDGKDSVGLPVQVEPATGLVDGQTVTVTGTGFPPNASVGVVMCTREAARDHGGRGAEACNLGRFAQAESSADGVVVVEFQVQRLMTLDGREVDCASEADRCLVGMGLISDYDQSGGAVVSFDPDQPLPDPPTAELSRSSGLDDGEEVELRITGLLPHSSVGVDVCDRDGLRCGGWGNVLPPADADGVLAAPVTLWRVFGVWVVRSGTNGNLDCAVEACSLHLYGETVGGRSLPPIDIDFDPSSDVPDAPVARLLEPGPFRPGGSIPIEVTGLPRDVQVDAMVCNPAGGECFGGGTGSTVDGTALVEVPLTGQPQYFGGACEGCVVAFSVYPLSDPGGLRPQLFPDPVVVTITG